MAVLRCAGGLRARLRRSDLARGQRVAGARQTFAQHGTLGACHRGYLLSKVQRKAA